MIYQCWSGLQASFLSAMVEILRRLAMADDWSREEVEAAVTDYFGMLSKELRGQPFNKAEHNRKLRQVLVKRTSASVERKHQNISAVLLELGYPYVNGYKPLHNYQELLRRVVEERLATAGSLHQVVAAVVESPAEVVQPSDDILSMLVDPPVREERGSGYTKQPRRNVRECGGTTWRWRQETNL